MKTFVSHNSALEFWRTYSLNDVRVSRANPQARSVPDKSVLKKYDFAAYGIATLPVHFAVSDAASRGQSKQVVCHTWNSAYPSESFVRASEGLYVSSPEACFFQIARQLSVVELVEVGIKFCGTYALRGNEVRGFRTRNPLMTISSLNRYAAKATGMHGVVKVGQALGYLAENSASPMETMLVMLLCLPCSMGGYGLELPKLNHRIDVSSLRQNIQQSYYGDLYWPRANLFVEYDSDMFHTDSKRIAHDSRRRVELARLGVSALSVTRRQVFDAREFDAVAKAIGKHIGKRFRSSRVDLLSRRYELRQQLTKRMRERAIGAEGPLEREYIDF